MRSFAPEINMIWLRWLLQRGDWDRESKLVTKLAKYPLWVLYSFSNISPGYYVLRDAARDKLVTVLPSRKK